MKFTSQDLLKAMGLKVGDVVKTIRGTYKIFYNEFNNIIELRDMETTNLYGYMESLIDVEFTIIQPKPTLTEDENVILRNLPKWAKWIERSKGGDLFINEGNAKGNNRTNWLSSFNHLFTFIKWEDKPYEIAELLK